MSYVNNFVLLIGDDEDSETTTDQERYPAIDRLNQTMPDGRPFEDIGRAYRGHKAIEAPVFVSSAGFDLDYVASMVYRAEFSDDVTLLVKEQDMPGWSIEIIRGTSNSQRGKL